MDHDEICTWKETLGKIGYVTWYTTCECKMDSDEVGNTEEYVYCPYCGNKIRIIRYWHKEVKANV